MAGKTVQNAGAEVCIWFWNERVADSGKQQRKFSSFLILGLLIPGKTIFQVALIIGFTTAHIQLLTGLFWALLCTQFIYLCQKKTCTQILTNLINHFKPVPIYFKIVVKDCFNWDWKVTNLKLPFSRLALHLVSHVKKQLWVWFQYCGPTLLCISWSPKNDVSDAFETIQKTCIE